MDDFVEEEAKTEEQIEDLLLSEFDDIKKSPRTPRRPDLSAKLKHLTHNNALSKIYMPNHELGVARKKSRSLNNSLNRQRKSGNRTNKTPIRKDQKF